MKTYFKQPRIINKKITNSARGEDCTLRIHGVCNFDNTTTIPAHINGGGMATKNNDTLIAYCCSDCHDWLDGGHLDLIDLSEYSETSLKIAIRDSNQLRAIVETQPQLIQKGLIKL